MACQLKARLLALDKEFVDAGASASTQTYTTTRAYLSLIHGLARQLKELGLTAQVLLKQKHSAPTGLQDRLKLLGRQEGRQ